MEQMMESELMLTHDISKMFHDLIRRDEEGDRHSNTCRQLLRHLSHQDGRTQLELAQLLHLTPPSISVALQKMETSGLIVRVQDQDDLRSTRVFLTETGKEAHEVAFLRIRTLEERAMSCLSDKERMALRKSLLQLREQIACMIMEDDR